MSGLFKGGGKKEWYDVSDAELKENSQKLVIAMTNGLEPFKNFSEEFKIRMYGLLSSIAYSATLDAKRKKLSLDDNSNQMVDLINGWVEWIIKNPDEAVKKSDVCFPNGFIQS